MAFRHLKYVKAFIIAWHYRPSGEQLMANTADIPAYANEKPRKTDSRRMGVPNTFLMRNRSPYPFSNPQ